jgi:hypothetical protein
MLFAVLVSANPVHAGNALVWTDKSDYSPEQTVIMHGSGFGSSALVTVTVVRPGGSVNPPAWSVTADASGSFTTTYLLDGITGTYNVAATDGTNTATTTFTDRPATKLVFTAGAGQTLTAGTVSAQVTVERPNPDAKAFYA